MARLASAAAVCAALLVAATCVAADGRYHAKMGTIASVPGLTMGPPYSAVIVYPTEAVEGGRKFPLLSFAHGTTAGGARLWTDYSHLLNTVASYGFIIIAPESCPLKECFSWYSKDQLASIAAAREHPDLHPALASVDWSAGVGVFGHSMGAMATVLSAEKPNAELYNITAAVPLHPCVDIHMNGALVSVPMYITTGSKDIICSPLSTHLIYEGIPGPKYVAELTGASHFEPTDLGLDRLGDSVAQFLACHLQDQTQCKAFANTCTSGLPFTWCKST